MIGINIGHSVGFGITNRREDVILIQAMFRYISIKTSPSMIGLDKDSEIPDVTGTLDPKTIDATAQFGFAFIDFILRWDVKMDPAHYKNRVINPQGKLMLITMLFLKTVDAQILSGEPDFRLGLIDLKPELARYINIVRS